MPSRLRCSRPQRTACSTQRKTVSQLERNRRAHSIQESTRAQLEMNHTNAWVACVLPDAHGTSSTTTPQRKQSTRRIAYTSDTAKPQNGTNVKWRGSSTP